MPYKFIGRTTEHCARNRFERYPEKSWLKILEVTPIAAPKNVPIYAHDNLRLVSVKCEKYWRGKKLPTPIYVTGASYKTDYKLIPKSEEAEYCQIVDTPEQRDVLPETADFPPLLKEILKRDKGDQLRLPLVYKRTEYNRMLDPSGHRATSPEQINSQFGKPVAPRLHENVLE
ncbi:Hypothetical predicted protein [Cloeon dipterum]|uniref:Uncharacterized protein n=1 Tax=Cloeon dipterum TaxID=197152 RepID=A0A8S1C326_9INSE|nr:Hypothetical predicted protein [Cloeon dipterum]